MSKAKYYGVTKDGKHLLKNIATGQIEIYETEAEAKLETSVSVGNIMPIYISKKDQQATIDKLVEALDKTNTVIHKMYMAMSATYAHDDGEALDIAIKNISIIDDNKDLINSVTEKSE